MERSRKIFRVVASASGQVVAAANEYADHKNSISVARCHFQLEEDMRRISVACECLADILDKPPHSERPTVDIRIQDWLETSEPQECLNTLSRMKSLLQQDDAFSWVSRTFGIGRSSTAQRDNIKEALDLFNSSKAYFHFLFSSEIWNNERAVQKQQDVIQSGNNLAVSVPVQAEMNTTVPLDSVDDRGGHVGPGTSIVQDIPPPAYEDNNTSPPEAIGSEDGHVTAKRRHQTKTGKQKEAEIMKWIDGLNCAEKQDSTLSLRQEDTCKWLFDTTQYKTWKDGRSESLWLRGKPGAGKSVLASFVIDSFRKAQRTGDILIFFYCDFRTERSTSSAEAMRSILSQLLRQLRDHSVDLENVFDDLIKAKEWGGGTLDNAKELAEYVSRAARQHSQRPVIVVDALDECKDMERLIQALMVFRGYVQLFVISRPLHAILDGLSDIPSVSMDDMVDELSADIELHVTRELDARQRLRDLDPGFKMEIHSVLCQRADGMFRWVQCSIDTLSRCVTRKEVRNALESLPEGLDETYERILLAIDMKTREGRLARRALVWLVAALRNLRLSELMEALSINLQTRTLDADIGPMHSGALLDACGSLVTYTEKTGIIILSHFSVKEYLMGELIRAKLPRYHISSDNAHLQLARSCMCYISICLKLAQGPAPANDFNGATVGALAHHWVVHHSRSRRLLDYVLDDALNHFQHLEPTFQTALRDVKVLAEDIQRHSWIWDHMFIPARWKSSDNRPHWPAARHDLLLYIVVAFAPNSFLNLFFRRTPLKPKEGTNPLVYAAYFNKEEHALNLLSRGARLNQRGWGTTGYCQSFPIEVAFQNRHYTMVTRFVEEGSTIPSYIFTDSFFRRSERFNSPDPLRTVPSSVARVLLQSDQFAESINDCLSEEALHAIRASNQLLVFRSTTGQDLVAIIRRFLQVADEYLSSSLIKDAFLRFAIAEGHISVARYLLTLDTPCPSDLLLTLHHYRGKWKTVSMIQFLGENGANLLARTNEGSSVLHALLWVNRGIGLLHRVDENEILKVVEFLVSSGCDPLEGDLHGNTPLHTAIRWGHVSVARYLLMLGAPLPPDLLATLDDASLRWRTGPMIRFLVENGANVLARSGDGRSTLHVVLQCFADDNSALDAVKVLVDRGCDPLDVDFSGNSPLRIAVERGYISVTRYFLTRGALLPPNIPVSSRLSWLSWNTLPMIRLLIENGADVLARTDDGESVLFIVLKRSHDSEGALEIVKVLVDHGCDPHEADLDGNTPLHIAVERGHLSVAQYLLTRGASVPPNLLFALARDRWPGSWTTAPMIHFLTENGVDVLARSDDGEPVLHIVLQSSNGISDGGVLETVKILVDHGCDPLEADSGGKTPLHIAVERRYICVARYLLAQVPIVATQFKDEPNKSRHTLLTAPFAKSVNGDALLHTIFRSRYSEDEALEMVKLFVGYGCDPLEADSSRRTPLHLAIENGYISTARYLIMLGLPLPPNLLVSLNPVMSRLGTAPLIPFLVENGVDVLARTDDGESALLVVLKCSRDDISALEAVKALVDYGCSPLQADSRGNTPIHVALEHGHMSAARFLLSLGAHLPPDLLVSSHSSIGACFTAQALHFLVENGVNILTHNSDGDSVLHIALQVLIDEVQVLDAVKLLVSYGCDPFEANARGETPLRLAIQQSFISVARYLLTLGASFPPDTLIASILRISRWRVARTKFIRFLVENGANPLVHTDDGDTVLHIALQYSDDDENEVSSVVQLLVSYGCDYSATNSHGVTPSQIAIECGFISVVRYLQTLGASVPPDILVTSDAALWARNWNTVNMIQFLVENGINVLTHTDDGDSVLHITLQHVEDGDKALKAVKLLVGHGCDPLENNRHGDTPLHIAVRRGYFAVARHLLTLGAHFPPDLLVKLDRDERNCTADRIRFMVENGVCPLARTGDGDSAFHTVLESTRCYGDDEALEAVELLVEYGCDPLEANSRGTTPLHVAVRQNYVHVVQYLLTLGAFVPPDLLVMLNDKLPQHWSSVPMIQTLVEHGVDVLAHRDTVDGDSVLHAALRCINDDNSVLKAVELLVGYGCDPLEANSRGDTPFRIAVERGYLSTARHFLTLGAVVPPDLLIALDGDRLCWGTEHMTRFLVENGANVSALARNGDSVLHAALRCSIFDDDLLQAVKLLVSYGCDPLKSNSGGETPLHIAARHGNVVVAQYLLEQGASVLTKAPNGDTVLHFATGAVYPSHANRHPDVEITFQAVKFFIKRGCEPALPNDVGRTPLHNAVHLGRFKMTQYLLFLNIPLPADILFTAIDSDDNSARRLRITKTLVTAGCDAQTPNSEGVTPLQAAIVKGRVEVVEYLLSVVSVHDLPREDLFSAVELAPSSVQGKMRHLLSDLRSIQGEPGNALSMPGHWPP